MLIYIMSAMAAGFIVLIKLYKHKTTDRLIFFIVGLMVVFEIIALVNYLLGGYNQAKTFSTSGVFAIIVAYLLFRSVKIANLALQVSVHFLKAEEDHSESSRKSVEKQAIPLLLYVLFFAGF